jgi:uncharacterized membrane protein
MIIKSKKKIFFYCFCVSSTLVTHPMAWVDSNVPSQDYNNQLVGLQVRADYLYRALFQYHLTIPQGKARET